MPRITCDHRTEEFDEEEWVVVRYLYVTAGHTGPGSTLTCGGEMNAKGFEDTQSMLRRVHDGRLTRKLSADIEHGQGAASKELFALIKKKWKLPYIKNYDAGPVVMQGTKRLGKPEDDPSLLNQVPTLGEVPVLAGAVAKLDALFPQGVSPSRTVVELSEPSTKSPRAEG